jgi:hypothetical protein
MKQNPAKAEALKKSRERESLLQQARWTLKDWIEELESRIAGEREKQSKLLGRAR